MNSYAYGCSRVFVGAKRTDSTRVEQLALLNRNTGKGV